MIRSCVYEYSSVWSNKRVSLDLTYPETIIDISKKEKKTINQLFKNQTKL